MINMTIDLDALTALKVVFILFSAYFLAIKPRLEKKKSA